jgi:hypothetical protein
MDRKVITKAKDACVLGKSWFLNHVIEDKPIARIDGKEVTLDEAVDEAAKVLMDAKFPILYGMSDTICEAQRQCAPIMDDCGGTIDTTTSVCHGPSGMAFQGVGEPTMTLGEVKNRADFVMYWGGNPAEAHPRHFSRYAVTPKGMFTPNGKDDRTVVIVDIRHTKTAGVADIFLQLKPGKDFELLEYEVLHNEDRDNVIKSVLDKINLKSLRVSGENNNEVWEKGWGEILEEISEKFHPDKIMPQYFDHHNIMRFDGHYIKAISSNFVYKYDQIIRKIIIKKHIDTKKLIEIGCGTGSGTLIAANMLSKNIELIASDWATKSQLIVDKISDYTKRPIKSVQFNMLDLKGWDELGVDKDSTIISFHALEQLGDNYKLLLDKLAQEKIKCIHLEPIVEFYDNNNLYDELALIYHKKRNYLGSYLSEIKRLEGLGKAKIIKEQRISFGDRYHEAYSLLIWQGK